MLADDDLSNAFFLRVRVVDLFAVDKQDHVRILFDCPRFTKVRHYRTLIRTLLQAPVQLRQRQHWHLELLGKRLHRARDFGNFRGAVFAVADCLHQLQVVDDNRSELASILAGETAGARAHLQRVHRRRLVDVYWRVVELAQRARKAFPVVVGQAAGANLLLVEPADRAHQSHGELRCAHFHAEDRNRHLEHQRDVFGDVQRQRGLAHAGPAGNDDQVALLKS